MATKPIPAPELMRQLLHYEAETGHLFWKHRDASWFCSHRTSAQAQADAFNRQVAGKRAFYSETHGYLYGCILQKRLPAHRVVWAIHHGKWPNMCVDHINGNKQDNRIENLRDVTVSENSRNQKLGPRNTSGVVGVSWDKNLNKWVVTITAEKRLWLGSYKEFNQAVSVRKEAESKFNYHPNHGRS